MTTGGFGSTADKRAATKKTATARASVAREAVTGRRKGAADVEARKIVDKANKTR